MRRASASVESNTYSPVNIYPQVTTATGGKVLRPNFRLPASRSQLMGKAGA